MRRVDSNFLPVSKALELPVGLLQSPEIGKVCSEFDKVAAAAAAELVESALTTRQSMWLRRRSSFIDYCNFL